MAPEFVNHRSIGVFIEPGMQCRQVVVKETGEGAETGFHADQGKTDGHEQGQRPAEEQVHLRMR